MPVTGSSDFGQAAIITSLSGSVPVVGEGDDGGAIESRAGATQPPPSSSSKLHALGRLTNGVRRARAPPSELEGGFKVLTTGGSHHLNLKSVGPRFINIAHPECLTAGFFCFLLSLSF